MPRAVGTARWTPQRVAEWLDREVGFPEYRSAFLAERINGAATCDDDAVSPAQLFEHAAGRVGGTLKHRWRVERLHVDDASAVERVEALRTGGRVIFLGGSIAFTF